MTRNEHIEISSELIQIEELAGKANQIWDSVCSNLMFANMAPPMKVLEYSLASEAVEKHVEAMRRLEDVRKRLTETMERTISTVILN